MKFARAAEDYSFPKQLKFTNYIDEIDSKADKLSTEKRESSLAILAIDSREESPDTTWQRSG